MAIATRPSFASTQDDTSLRDAMRERLKSRKAERLGRRISFMDWALKVPEPKAGILNFDVFPMQREMYEEAYDDRETVVKKSTQCGITAWALRWALYHTDLRGMTGLYVFPTLSDVYDLSDARVKPIIGASKYLRGRVLPADPQNKGLMKIGLGFCLTSESMVLTRSGYVSIRDVTIGDEVLTHRGRWRRVTGYSARIAPATVVVKGHGIPEIRATPEHPFWVRGSVHRQRPSRREFAEPTWREAGSLNPVRSKRVGDFVAQITPPVEGFDKHSEAWWWCVGRYLADGWSNAERVEFYVADAERDVLVERLQRAFGRVGHLKQRENGSWMVAFGGTAFARELDAFGHGAHGKRLTGAALALPDEQLRALLDGYLSGDGCWVEEHEHWIAVTVSRALALGLALAWQRLEGVPPTVTVQRHAGKNVVIAGVECDRRDVYYVTMRKKAATAHVETDGVAWKAVRSVEPAGRAVVYNISVEEDESFLADNCIVHNCYFRGSESKRKLDSVDADHLIIDEYDTCAAENLPDAERRLSGPLSKGLIRRLGVPSIPSWGISRAYDDSDQRRWHVKCGGCGEWQPITFFDNVDQNRCLVVCKECMRPLDVRGGEWVATYPDRSVRGYHVTRLIAPTANIEAIVKQSQKRSPTERQVFFNKDLGEEYAPAEGRLSREALQAAQSAGGGYVQVPGYIGPPIVTMGVDVASTRALNVRISKILGDEVSKIALFIGEVDNFNELGRLMERYSVHMACVDHLPDGRMARSFAERFAGRVFLCAYDTTPTPKTPQVLKVDEEMRFVKVRRTEAMDATAQMIRAQQNKLPLDLPHGYVEAMQAPVRVVTEDELGRKAVSYRSMGTDDWFHAEVYDLVALECWWFRQHRESQEREQMTPLEEMLEFERSHLADPHAEPDYSPGGYEDGYYPGGGEGM